MEWNILKTIFQSNSCNYSIELTTEWTERLNLSLCIWKMAEGKTLSLPPSMGTPKLQLFKDQLLMQKSRRQAEKVVYN